MEKSYLAPAKINLDLHITGRLDNGFHLLDSLVYFTHHIGDKITLKPSEMRTQPLLTISGAFAHELSAEQDNLVCRAAACFQNHYNLPKIPALHLQKDLPIASGIGGGSSDAAAVIHALAGYFNKDITEGLITELCQLGADIPVCITQAPCHMSGIGEIITPTPMPRCHMVLINPLQSVSTPAIFQEYRKSGAHFSETSKRPVFPNFSDFIAHLNNTHNDLQPPANALLTQIDAMLEAIMRTENCHLARMSGSGATCFGLYATATDAMAAAKELQESFPTYWVKADVA